MKFIIKGLVKELHKYNRSVYGARAYLSQSSKKIPNPFRKDTGNNKGNNLGISPHAIIIGSISVFGLFGYNLYLYYHDLLQDNIVHKELKPVNNVTEDQVGKLRNELPSYSLDEISKHNSLDSKLWVIYKNGVYDVTEFVRIHPGGRQILKAGGKRLEPFFQLYAIHQTETTYTILEQFRIGNVKM